MMSAYSDWKCGALEYCEYRQECEYEARRDRYCDDGCDEEEADEDDWC